MAPFHDCQRLDQEEPDFNKKANQTDLFDYCDFVRNCSLSSRQGRSPQFAICPIRVELSPS